jgi:hypothetical protein
VTTVVAAFVGALVGSIGSVLVEELLRRRRVDRQQREALVRRYLFPLQDAAETLWHRLYNIGHQGGRGAMSKEYLRTSTVYALGRVFAAERALGEDGIYPILQEVFPTLAEKLEKRLIVGLSLGGLQLYDRIALGEAVLERDDQGSRPGTYLAFRNRFGEGATEDREWLARAAEAVNKLPPESINRDLALLGTIVHLAADITKLPPSITEKETELGHHDPTMSI